MPNIYLSPSTQEGNPYIIGNSEEYYMNLIADAMVPFLHSSGIRYTRNSPEMTAAEAIVQSNQGQYDLHLALHSNASSYGTVRGSDTYYFPSSTKGKQMAEIAAHNLKAIYPLPSLVRTLPTTSIGEVSKTNAPAILIELAYHDNPEDAAWIRDNISFIAQDICLSLTEYFDIPLVTPQSPREATVTTQTAPLKIRLKPSISSAVLTQAPKGSNLIVLGKWQDWYVVNYKGSIGYASTAFITLK